MGNYFARLPYINSGYQTENNNMMDANIAVHVKEHRVPKISCSYVNAVDTALAVNQMQNECKKDSSVIMKLWTKLNNFYTSPFAPCATNLIERSSRIISLQGNSQINSAKLINFISSTLKSQRSPKYCLKYIRPITPDVTNVLEENRQITSVQHICERSWKKECEAESDDFSDFTLNSKQYQVPEAQDYVEQCHNRPLTSFSFQRLDSGIEDPPYPRKTRCQIGLHSEHLIDSCFEDSSYHYRTRTQIDSDSLYFSTMIRTVANEAFCLSEDRMCGTGRIQGCHKAISFFIDIRDPLQQKPLGEEYKFLACDECDSMFSDKCSESSNEDYHDDDFIFFHESSSEETDGCGFNFTLNTCTPAEISCSLSANSTSCFDISMDTSAHENPRNANKESSVSVKIGVRPGGNGKTCESPRLKYNSSDAGGCVDFNDFPEITYSSRLTTSTSSFTVCNNSSGTDDDECTLIKPNYTSEVTNENISSNLKTTSCDAYNTEKKKSRKKVCFQKDEDLVEVHQMIHWDFAYREARKATWELAAVDRCRFLRRIRELELILSPCLRRKLESIQNK